MKHSLIQLTNAELKPISNPKNRYFFSDDIDEATCYKLDSVVKYLLFIGKYTSELSLAQRETASSMFYCRHFGEVSERGECGKDCPGYEPRNGKSGVCKHFGYTYSDTQIKFELQIIEN